MPATPSQIVDWLRAARSGDVQARNDLFGACRSFVAVIAQVQLDRRLQQRVDSSDIVQQSLLDAHRDFSQFRGESPGEWMAWLKQVAIRNAIDAARRHGGALRDVARERPIAASGDSQPGELHPAACCPTPSQAVAELERELIVAAALERLPEDQRRVVLLRNVERLPFDDVARHMSRSRGACQMLWLRAMERLKDMLREDRI